MAVDNTILVRRGSGTPSYSDFTEFELAYDYSADKLYIRDGNAMVEVGGSSGAVSAVANGSNDRIATFSSSTALNGEANLTFSDSNNYLTVHEAGSSTGSHLRLATDNSDFFLSASGSSNQLTIYDANAAANRLIVGSTGNFTIPNALSVTSSITTGYGLALNNGNTNFLLYNNSGEDVLYMRDTTNGQMLQTWRVSSVDIHRGMTINQDGGAYDTRIEGDTDTHLFFVDASADRVGISTSSPGATLDIGDRIYLKDDGTIHWGSAAAHGVLTWDTGRAIVTATGANNLDLKAQSGYQVVVNESQSNVDFRVESDTNAHLLFADASSNRIGILSSSPNATLDVAGIGQFRGTSSEAVNLYLGQTTSNSAFMYEFSTYDDAGGILNVGDHLQIKSYRWGQDISFARNGQGGAVPTARFFSSGSSGYFDLYKATDPTNNANYETRVKLNVNGDSYLNGGEVGIGLTSPSAKLHVQESGTGHGSGGIITETATQNGNAGIRFRTNSTDRWAITTIGTNGADLRIRDADAGTERFKLHSDGLVRSYGNHVFGAENSNSKAYIRANNGYSAASTPDYTWWYNDTCGIFHPAANTIGFSTGSNERFRLSSDGDFKFTGTNSNFESVLSGGNTYYMLSGTATQRIEFRNTSNNANGWIGIPSWNTDAWHEYMPTSNGNELAYIYESSAHHYYRAMVINNAGEDYDFTVKGNSDDNLIKTDAGNDRVGIGISAPGELLHVDGSIEFAHRKYNTGNVSVAGAGELNSVAVPLSTELGTTLNVNYQYKITLNTIGTGTDTGAVYILTYNQDGGAWKLHLVSRNGSSSNHPLALVSGSNLKVYHNHSGTYNIRYFIEFWDMAADDGTLHGWGSDFMWTRDVNTLSYTDGLVEASIDLGSGSNTIKKTFATNNYPAVTVHSSGTGDSGAAIAIQQATSEGDTIIFADFEPHVEWGISAENSANRIDFTGGSSSPSLGTRTFKNNSGNDRTAYRKMSVRLDNGNVDIAGNLTVANGSAYAGDSTSGVLSTGSWIGDLGSNGWERVCGVQHDGGVFSIVEKNAQISTIVDGSYFAYEAGTNQGGGFYSSSDSSYANATGIVASGGTLYVKQADGTNASLFSTGDIICNSGFISGQGNDLQLRRTTNSDDRIVIEASETKIYGDAVERVRFGSYGIRNGYSGSEGGPVYSFKDDTDTGLWRAASDTLAVTTGGTNRMKFQSDGKIGVNGDTSDAFFRINSTSSQNGLKIIGQAARAASRHALHIDDNDTNGRGSVVIDSASGTGMKITTQGSNWNMELVSADNGGSPAMSMGVRMQSFEGRANGHYHFDEDYSGQWFSGNRYAGSMQSWQVGHRDGSSGETPDYIGRARIYVTTDGDLHANEDVIAFSSTIGSDRKLKKNVKDINYGLKDVLNIRAVEFDWKEKRKGQHDIGFIAQEIEKIIPEVVNEVMTIGDGAQEGDTHKTVDYAKLTSVLIKAVQEQQQQINELKEKLNG